MRLLRHDGRFKVMRQASGRILFVPLSTAEEHSRPLIGRTVA
jgi:hypothetical protein